MPVIELSQGKSTQVDEADFALLSQWKWHVNNFGYAVRSQYIGKSPTGATRNKKVLMHRVLMPDTFVDHINEDKLDNRRSNLRYCTYAQNLRNKGLRKDNTSGYKGVTWHAALGKWRAKAQVNGKTYDNGLYRTKEEAALAYNELAQSLHGEFAKLNEVVL